MQLILEWTTRAWLLLAVLAFKSVGLVVLSMRQVRVDDVASAKSLLARSPVVSVIVPCHNEAVVLENCISSLLAQSYTNLEVLIIDDGSTDETASIAGRLSRTHPNVYHFSKSQGGKANALNDGLTHATGEYVVTMDADSAFTRSAVAYLIAPFADDTVGAVGGNVKVANRRTLLGRQQGIEYVAGLNLQRRAFARLGCMQVISGAIGAFRRHDLIAVGGYSDDTVVEDMDITVTMVRAGRRVVFAGRGVAYTEAPESLRDLYRQRFRWTFGGFEVVRKHRDVMFNRRHGAMGLVGLPYFLVFPWIDVAVSLLFGVAIVRVALGDNVVGLVQFYCVMAAAHAAVVVYAAWTDGGERLRLAAWSIVDSLWYSHVISFVTAVAGWRFVRGGSTSWNKLDRMGHNHLPDHVVDLREVIDLRDGASDIDNAEEASTRPPP